MDIQVVEEFFLDHFWAIFNPIELPPSLCEKMFKSKQTLEAHEREHRGERPFPCSMCSAGFTSYHGLDQHVKGTHKIVGPKGGKAGWVHGKNNHRRSYL